MSDFLQVTCGSTARTSTPHAVLANLCILPSAFLVESVVMALALYIADPGFLFEQSATPQSESVGAHEPRPPYSSTRDTRFVAALLSNG